MFSSSFRFGHTKSSTDHNSLIQTALPYSSKKKSELPLTSPRSLISAQLSGDGSSLSNYDQFTTKPSVRQAIIDLTIDNDEEDELSPPRKKSRTSSLTDVSPRSQTQKPHRQAEKGLKLVSKSKKPAPQPAQRYPSKGKGVQLSSSGSRSDSEYPIPAVIVPPPQPSPEEARRIFYEKIQTLGAGISLWNSVDGDSPPYDFRFIKESVTGPGVTRTPEDYMSGCECRKDNGRQMGCEYLSCECLEDSALNDDGKRVFPYGAGKNDYGCLRNFYLDNRHHIYECNALCNCEKNCKNRVVQHGRTLLLQIFKTTNRGWSLRCLKDIKKGQFVDTYRGEIITNEEANRRGKFRNVDQEIYLMDLDKWTEEEGSAQYVVDGMHMGGPTRFINHSCEPNCTLYTVSYNHADKSVYELAFFAHEIIPEGTELTFDYVGEEDDTPISDERAAELAKEKGYFPQKCLCGADSCRGYFFN